MRPTYVCGMRSLRDVILPPAAAMALKDIFPEAIATIMLHLERYYLHERPFTAETQLSTVLCWQIWAIGRFGLIEIGSSSSFILFSFPTFSA